MIISSGDRNGRVTGKTEIFSDGTAAHYFYDYDAVGRLLSVTKDGTAVESYQYDTRHYGTRTYQEINGVGRPLSYNAEDNLLTAGTVSYQHDADGFLVSRTQGTQVTTYDYSLRGELLSMTLPDGRAVAYVHDPLGRRLAKKVNGSVVEKYLWEGLTRLLAVYDGDSNLLMRFEYADARMPVAMTKDGVKYYLAYDQIGTLKAVADSSGTVLLKRQYDSFGNILSEENSLPFEVPFGFAGGLYDRDTGLVRFGYRDYDPETGRWTAKDPILFAGGDTDLYGYCVNDPVNWIDPPGLAIAYTDPKVGVAVEKLEKKSPTAKEIIQNLVISSETIIIRTVAEEYLIREFLWGINHYDPQLRTVIFDPCDNRGRPSEIGLIHELRHALQHVRGEQRSEDGPNGAVTIENKVRDEYGIGRRPETYQPPGGGFGNFR